MTQASQTTTLEDLDMIWAVKVQFENSSKIYEYSLLWSSSWSQNILKRINEDKATCYGVVDARGFPAVVKILRVIPYADRMYEGDLKPLEAMIDGALIYTKPKEARRKRDQGAGDDDGMSWGGGGYEP